MLLLGVCDAAQRRPEVDAEPVRGGGAVGARAEAGILEGQPTGDQAELAEAVELAGGLGGIQANGSKSSTRRDLRSERAGIEAVDAPGRRATGSQAGPESVDPGADRADDPDARDPDPASLAHDPKYVRSPDVDPIPDRVRRRAPRPAP